MIPYVVKGQLDSLEKELEAKIDNASSEPKSVTYDELVALVHSSKLIVGKEYRITDYCTTIVEENAADPECEFGLSPYKSAKHQFDIIVTAVSKDKLGQKARAAIHEGDEYFADSHLEQWELGYILENDDETSTMYDLPAGPYGGEYCMFSEDAWTVYPLIEEKDDGPSWMPHYYVWSDDWDYYVTENRHPETGDDAFMIDDLESETRPEPSGGKVSIHCSDHFKGKIFYLKDEFNNCANFDFKNIMTHSRYVGSDGQMDVSQCLNDRYYYLFDCGIAEAEDNSVVGNSEGYLRCYNNKIANGGSPEDCVFNGNFGTIIINYGSVSGVVIDQFLSDRTQNIVLSSNKTSNLNISDVHIGSGCSSILVRCSKSYPAIKIDIGNNTSGLLFDGQLNGSLKVGCNCKNVAVYSMKTSESKTTSQSAVTIGDNCRNITLGDPAVENTKVQSNIVIGNRCYDVNLPGYLLDTTLGNWCTDIKCDSPNSSGKYVALQFITLGNRCQNITFKLADTRGNYYKNFTLCDAVKYMTFEQDNTGKGSCQDTIVQNIFVATGVESTCNTKDARFEPATSQTNTNYGQTYFTLDANKDTIMYWFSSGITMAGKKWDKTNNVWVAL